MVSMALTYNLVVFLDPIETGGWLVTLRNNGSTKAYNYGVYVGNRYKNFTNIIWMSGNDFQTWRNSDDDAVVRAVAQGIKDNDTNHLQTTELDFTLSSSLNDTNWNSILGLNGTYTYFPTYAQLELDYNRTNFLPNFLVEANYEFEALAAPETLAPELRKQEWWTFTSGGCGHIYGNHYTWTFAGGWQGNLDTPGATQIGYLSNPAGGALTTQAANYPAARSMDGARLRIWVASNPVYFTRSQVPTASVEPHAKVNRTGSFQVRI